MASIVAIKAVAIDTPVDRDIWKPIDTPPVTQQ